MLCDCQTWKLNFIYFFIGKVPAEINIISSEGPEFLSELLEMTQVFIFNPS